ncbi:MAG: NUDIX domain-containing protein [Halieaceae bacterium]|jgi:8-oxo-dGTP diphosphatase|nr:NUDIX domain-containing protein [Halieaceae bacterium]
MQDGVILVIQRGQRFLVGRRAAHKRAAGYWTQVSGTVEAGEAQPDAVVREAMEELGCVVRPVEKIQTLVARNARYRLHYWRCELLQGEPRICNDELTALRWVNATELGDLQPVFEEDLELFSALAMGRSLTGECGDEQ